MIYDILFAVCGVGLIAVGFNLFKLDDRIGCWISSIRHHEKLFTDIEWHRAEDLGKLADSNQRIKALEDRLEGQEALTVGLEEKIKALEETVEYLEGKL